MTIHKTDEWAGGVRSLSQMYNASFSDAGTSATAVPSIDKCYKPSNNPCINKI